MDNKAANEAMSKFISSFERFALALERFKNEAELILIEAKEAQDAKRDE